MAYYKEFFIFRNDKPVKAIIRSYTQKDFNDLIQIQKESFPPPFPSELWWNKKQLQNHITLFPEGALCIEIEGVICGSITSLIVDMNNKVSHTWEAITDNGYISNHNEKGNTLYVVDICVTPSCRSLGIGKLLMQSLYELVIHKDLLQLQAGCRIPGYHLVSNIYSPLQYMNNVIDGTIHDVVMSFFMKCGSKPESIVYNYLEDEESHNCAVLMEWKNPFLAIKQQSKKEYELV